jgi:enoyl-[acyl-carrier-protein] reductase (NADH)
LITQRAQPKKSKARAEQSQQRPQLRELEHRATAEEVANVAAFLLGPGGRAFTGSPVVMDNGWIAR